MSISTISLVPLSTYNVKDFLNVSTKLTSLVLMSQTVFSVQMSSAVGIKTRINKKSNKEEGIQQTSKNKEL